MISLDWLAGFIDGEGTITVVDCKNPRPLVSICQCDELILQTIQAQFGGDIQKKKRRKVTWSQAWELRWSGASAIKLLEQLRERLKVKRTQAEILLTEWVPLQLPRTRRGRGNGLTANEKMARQLVKSKINQLNNSITIN